MRRFLLFLSASFAIGSSIAAGCAHGVEPTGSTSTGTGGATSSTTTSSVSSTSSGTMSKCGPKELCDPDHLGLDDNCDGQVDEGCACLPGQAHSCFEGDPSYHGAPGCYDGTELCTDQGAWGPCTGGVHATPPDNCFLDDTTGPHAITALPFQVTDLSTGLGSFGADAQSETYAVTCPPYVAPCPAPSGPMFRALQSGEYTVTYTKTVSGGGMFTRTYPLIVGAPGLRVELSWEHTVADNGVDLDLHLHQPGSTAPWGITPAVPQDCTWANCVFTNFEPPQAPEAPFWFPGDAAPPDPTNWTMAADPAQNSCYGDPRGVGTQWQSLGMGCHNPRLDVDEIICDASITDPSNFTFCTPENINMDVPPPEVWTRVGVHYYNNHGQAYDVHPVVRVFCDGALAGLLGPGGYYVPESPVTFSASDGAGTGSGNRFWMVADVKYTVGSSSSYCTVMPLYSDATTLTPLFTIDTSAVTSIGPAYPP